MSTLQVLLALGVIIAVGGGAWLLGVRSGERRLRAALERAADPDAPGDPGSLVGVIRGMLQRSWVPRGSEEEDTVRAAVARLHAFISQRLAEPLSRGLEGNDEDLRESVEAALTSVDDLEYFLDELPTDRETANLTKLVRQVTGEYAADWDVLIKVAAPDTPVVVTVGEEPFLDALYLILHNAGQFGGGAPVRVTVDQGGGYGRVVVRDRGPGFTAESLSRAYDPFYSTAPGGLGLGLPHARRVIQAMGGEIHLRNAGDGGAEVEVSVPRAGR